MAELGQYVGAVEKDGLVWVASKLAAIGFVIKKLQINLSLRMRRFRHWFSDLVS